MNLKRKSMILFCLGIIYTGCSVYDTNNYGYMITSISFPNTGFTIKEIPENTSIISVEVSGAGLGSPIKINLTKDKHEQLLTKIPVGNKLVQATALNDKGQVLAKGRKEVSVEKDKKTTVEIVLVVVQVNQNPCVSPLPNQLNTKATAVPGNEPQPLTPGFVPPSPQGASQPQALGSQNQIPIQQKPCDPNLPKPSGGNGQPLANQPKPSDPNLPGQLPKPSGLNLPGQLPKPSGPNFPGQFPQPSGPNLPGQFPQPSGGVLLPPGPSPTPSGGVLLPPSPTPKPSGGVLLPPGPSPTPLLPKLPRP